MLNINKSSVPLNVNKSCDPLNANKSCEALNVNKSCVTKYCKFGNFRTTFISQIFYLRIIHKVLNWRMSVCVVFTNLNLMCSEPSDGSFYIGRQIVTVEKSANHFNVNKRLFTSKSQQKLCIFKCQQKFCTSKCQQNLCTSICQQKLCSCKYKQKLCTSQW